MSVVCLLVLGACPSVGCLVPVRVQELEQCREQLALAVLPVVRLALVAVSVAAAR
jgi:hypothetical protein